MEKKIGQSIEKIMIEVVQNAHSVFAWKSLNGEIEKCELKVKAYRKEYNEIELEIVPSETKKIADIVNGKKEINVYIPESSVSFIGNVKKTLDDKKLKILIPLEFEFFERRKHERVQPKKGFFTFEINKMSIKKPVFDLSMGGFAIILPRTEKISLKKGMILESSFIEINSRKIKVQLECVSSISIDRYKLDSLPYGGHKLAFRFLSISKEDRDYIAEVVTIEAIMNKQLKGA